MKKNWIENHKQGNIKKFQQGGPMAPAEAPVEGGAPAGPEAGAPAPGAEVDAMLAEYAQSRDPQLAVAICDMLVEMLAGAQGGAPAPGGAPGAPMARNGMKFKTSGPVFKK